MTLASFLWLFREEIGLIDQTTTATDHAISHFGPPDLVLCKDDDDPFMPRMCNCFNPAEPVSSDDVWMAHHLEMVSAAQRAAQIYKETLDVVFIGDSIIERLNGTRTMGTKRPYPEYSDVFERHFDKARNAQATLQGIALGSSGDTTNHLLWHFQHNLLPNELNPKVWFLLIGTNNMGRDGCAKRGTLGGILQSLQALQNARPKSPVILHGLLPRDDPPNFSTNPQKYALGRAWSYITWINAELEKKCNLLRNCYFMNSADMFLRVNNESILAINSDTMDDGLHPNVPGYEAWAKLVVREIEGILKSR